MQGGFSFIVADPVGPLLLRGAELDCAQATIIKNHYLHSVPSGKSHYVRFGPALVVWSIPANNNIGRFLFGFPANVWELSRLWAPDGHADNLLTQAISAAVGLIQRLERPDGLVSYADPNQGHRGGIYLAASWTLHGRSEDPRAFRKDGKIFTRRSFHSDGANKTKAELIAAGYEPISVAGKIRFVRALSKRAKRALFQKGQDDD